RTSTHTARLNSASLPAALPIFDRTWTAEDACHNVSTCVQHISFADTSAPRITCPGDKVLACGDSTDPSNTGSATATDNCGGDPTDRKSTRLNSSHEGIE